MSHECRRCKRKLKDEYMSSICPACKGLYMAEAAKEIDEAAACKCRSCNNYCKKD